MDREIAVRWLEAWQEDGGEGTGGREERAGIGVGDLVESLSL